MTTILQSFVAGRWIGSQPAQALHSAINGKEVAFAHAERLDFEEALQFGRSTGLQSMLALDFQQRAAALRALAKYLGERKEELYAISAHTGATRIDSWVDIEGGTGTLFAYAGMAASELPSGNLIHEGPVGSLVRKTLSLAPIYWFLAAVWQSTSMLSISQFGVCWKNLHPRSWPACLALGSPLRPPAT